VTPIEDDEPLSRLQLPQDQQDFLRKYEELVVMLPWDVRSDEYHRFNDMLAQANRWGQEQARASEGN
jgi:hypothetical protein